MTIPTISTLPTAPARTDPPVTFVTRADSFLAALVVMQGELNTSIGAMNTDIAQANTDATAAAASASAAATSESNASTSESNAATSESNAASSAAAAASSYDQFDDRYLGSKASDPAVDNDGNALLTGALYFNTTSDDMKVYTGSTWKVTGFNPDSPTFTETVTAPSFDLNSIAATNADTAVDIFIYDTRKDSDGGAWRKRTQNTSWYNETLDTATRGSRKEFPAVAVIVGTSTKLTVYDGDNPDLPMWMVFDANVSGNDLMRNNGIECITAENGSLVIGLGNGFGLIKVNMIADYGFHWTATAAAGYYNSNISNRNNASNFTRNIGTTIVGNYTNDVAMTVLPNASIDAATGLPVPTIAVATDGGVSVIKGDGSVYDLAPTNSPAAHIIDFHDDYIYVSSDIGGYDANTIYKFSIPSSDQTNSFYSQMPSYIAGFNNLRAGTHVGNQGNGLVNGSAYGSSLYGLGLLSEDTTTPANSSMAYITSDFNTGWMNGDIKLATLSDTDDTNVTGSELVTNGTFDTNTSGWTDWDNISNPSAASQSGGKGILDGSVATPSDAKQDISVVAGKTYVLSLTMQNNSGGTGRIYISDGANYIYALGSLFATSTETTFSKTITPTQSTVRLYAYNSGSGSATFDNISLRIAEEDRSVNDKGLQVFGTITKDPVASGADLVAYSGFSASNYLEQPYNSDLDFGTGDFSIMGWINVGSSVSAYASILSRVLSVNTETNAWSLRISSSANNYYFYTNNTSLLTSPLTRLTWQFLTVARRSGVVYFYVDGALRTSNSMANTITNVGASVVVGYESTHDIGNSSVALWRISATAPTADQIAKIYEDEKVLFQENSQATLYGSSDSVTALAYDDDTELLHVGTSEGRSVFQGLRRVDNTASAVGAAISASNGLVAED